MLYTEKLGRGGSRKIRVEEKIFNLKVIKIKFEVNK